MRSSIGIIVLSLIAWRGLAASDSAAESMRRLTDGNQRFAKGRLEHPGQTTERRSALVKTQHPFAAVLSCSDSRVPPEIVFDVGLGDLFTIRVAGNIVDNAVLGSIEYGAEHLNVPLVVVLGHTGCGAVKATLEGDEPGTHIEELIDSIRPAVKEAKREKGDVYNNAVRENVYRSVKQLREAKPILTALYQNRKIQVVGAIYHMDTGVAEFLPDK